MIWYTRRMGTKDDNMFVWEGSQVQLRCIVQNTLAENLGKLIWYKNGVQIDKLDPFSRNVVFQVSPTSMQSPFTICYLHSAFNSFNLNCEIRFFE
jgi:hypothetical protein